MTQITYIHEGSQTEHWNKNCGRKQSWNVASGDSFRTSPTDWNLSLGEDEEVKTNENEIEKLNL